MNFTSKSYPIEKEVLANDHFVALPITLDFSSVTALENGVKVVKAGSPITTGGVFGNGANAVLGILRHNVYETNPNGALVVHGWINKAAAKTNIGADLAIATWTSYPATLQFV